MNLEFLVSKDCLENVAQKLHCLQDVSQKFSKRKGRCAGRPVNLEFRTELLRRLVEKFQGGDRKVKTSSIRLVAKELAKKHPFSLDESLQRMRFCRRWCLAVESQLALGNPIKTGRRTAAPPGAVSFSFERICSECKSAVFSRVKTQFSEYEPFLGLLFLVQKAPNRDG